LFFGGTANETQGFIHAIMYIYTPPPSQLQVAASPFLEFPFGDLWPSAVSLPEWTRMTAAYNFAPEELWAPRNLVQELG
jgi:hypothetical protein